MKIVESGLITKEAKVVVVVIRFNRFINQNLLAGALDILQRVGHVNDDNITVVWVPGAYEVPLTVKALAISRKYDAIIVLGTVIRGVTMHFEFVSRECSSGLSNIAVKNMLPIGFGLLVTDDVSQAIERAGIKNNNKGAEAALAILEMINILKIIKQ